MKVVFALIIFIFSSSAQLALAQTPDCTSLTDKIRTFTLRVNENNYAVASFVGEVSVAMDTWYGDYSQFEDQTVAVAPDYFSPLRDAADEIGNTVNVAYDQMDILDQEGQSLVELAETCLGTTPTP